MAFPPQEATGPERIGWVDVGRGMGIALMTFGHVTATVREGWALPALATPTAWLYLFHMPAFFLLGGITYRPGRTFSRHLRHRARALLVPYAVWSLYFVAKPFALAALGMGAPPDGRELLDILVGIALFGRGLWFLMAMFVGGLVAHAMIDALGVRGAGRVLVGCALVAASYALEQAGLAEALPFELVRGLRGGGLICLGSCLRGPLVEEGGAGRGGIAAGLLLALAALAASGGPVLGAGGGWPLRAVAATSGSLALALLARLVGSCAPLEAIGRESLDYYVVAPWVTNVVRLACMVALPDAGTLLPPLQWALALLMCAATLALSRVAVAVIRRRLGWSLGGR